jgi:hypothetical protein
MAGRIFNLFTPGALVGETSIDMYTPVVDVSEFRSGSAQLEVFGMQGAAGPPATALTVDIQFSDDGLNWSSSPAPANFVAVGYAGPGPTTASQLVWLDGLPAYVRLHITLAPPQPPPPANVNIGATFRVTASLKTE